MPSVPELNAAYDSLKRNVDHIAHQLLPMVPFMFRGSAEQQVNSYLASADARREILEAAKDVLVAAEKARLQT